MAVTQRDVARAAGVSRATVSNAFARPGLLEPRRLRQVLACAERLGYRPDVAARSVRSGRRECVALLHDARDQTSHLPRDLLLGIADALDRHDRYLAFAAFAEEDLGDGRAPPKVLRQVVADALLLNVHGRLPQALARAVAAGALPAAWLNTRGRAGAVHPDEIAAGRLAAGMLLQRGHRRLAWIDHRFSRPPAHFSRIDRRAGVHAAAATAGATVADLVVEPDRARREAALDRLLASPDRPTGAVCYGQDADWLIAAATRAGVRVPGDLSVVTFADEPRWWGALRVASVLTPWRALGEAAVGLVLGGTRRRSIAVPPAGTDAGETLARVPR